MPWWVKIYLFLYFLLVLGGLYDDYKSKSPPRNYLFSILSGIFIFSFTSAYFNPELAGLLGLWVVPMAVLGAIWEFYLTVHEISQNEYDPEFTEVENRWIVNSSMIIVNLFVVPGYFLGFVLSYKAIKTFI